MGFKKQTTIFELAFADKAYEGLEVRAKSIPSGDFLDLMEAATALDLTKQTFSESDLHAVKFLFDGFAKALISWNLEDEFGTAIPATLEGVRDQEFPFLMPIITAWMDAVAGVSADLGKESRSGVTSPDLQIPMAVS